MRQNPAPAIREAKAGGTVVITERGVPVAQLGPLSEPVPLSDWGRMVAAGRVRLPIAGDSAITPVPRRAATDEESPSEVLRRMRDAEQW